MDSTNKDGYEVVDKRRINFTILPNSVLSLKSGLLKKIVKNKYALPCYALIASKQNNTWYIPSVGYIAKSLGVSRITISRAFKHLELLKLISIQTRVGYKNKITLLDIPEAMTETDLLIVIDANYSNLPPRTKEAIKDYIINDKPLDTSRMPASVLSKIENDRSKFRLVK